MNDWTEGWMDGLKNNSYYEPENVEACIGGNSGRHWRSMQWINQTQRRT